MMIPEDVNGYANMAVIVGWAILELPFVALQCN